MRFGAGFWGPYPLARYVDLAVHAERAGFDVAWIGDTQLLTPDVYSAMALCANATSRIAIGSGVTNSVTRDVTVTAGGFLALNEFAHGRCLLGIGVGGSAVNTVGLPEDRAREFRTKVGMLRGLVRGETVAVHGDVLARGKIAAPPVPIYVASSSPLGLEIAGELADGVILNVGVIPELVHEAMEHVRRGARAAGRNATSLDVAVIAGSSIHRDRAVAIDEARSWAATTARRIGKWMTAGGDEMRSLGAAIRAQYRWDEHIALGATHARAVSDEMASSFAFAGTADDVRRAIERLEPCGVTHVIGLMVGASIDATLDAYARDIIPAWRRAPVRTTA
jgi:alkanesulfonate monooxygenase SsuD/methylene tetrahydromethanopterin reductase-like flavin-dependent oxidoreductase (luciferase family)